MPPALIPAAAGYIGSKVADGSLEAPDWFAPDKNPYHEEKPFEVDMRGGVLSDKQTAWDLAQRGFANMNDMKRQQGGFYDQAMTGANAAQAGPAAQAVEEQWWSAQQGQSRGDQRDALGLMAGAARGEAPSQAQSLMAQGMNQAIAQGQAAAGGARGAAALANAQSNAAANTMNLQQSTANQMAALRANEMAQARGEYGGMASNLRQADLARLQQSTNMNMFNAGQTNQGNIANAQMKNQYMTGMGGLSVGMGGNVNNAYMGGLRPLEAQTSNNATLQDLQNNAHQASEDRKAGRMEADTRRSQENRRENIDLGVNSGKTTGEITAGALK